jgi:hypothetical protein
MFTCGCRFDEDPPDGDESDHYDALPGGPHGVDGNDR